MCLAIPGMVTEISEDRIANVDILGAQRSASLDLVPQAQVGDYVLVHAGFAIEVVDPQFAQETLDLIKEFPELIDSDVLPNVGTVDAAASASTQSAALFESSPTEVGFASEGGAILGTSETLADVVGLGERL